MIEILLRVFITYIMMYAFHEIGHLLMLLAYKIPKKDIKIRLTSITYNSNLKKEQKQAIIIAGIILGYLPIAMLGGLDYSIYLLLTWAYLWGCLKDLKKIDWKRIKTNMKDDAI